MSHPRFTARLRALLLAAGCVAVLGVAACGGDDTTTSTTSSTTTSTETSGGDSTSASGGTNLGDASALRDQFNQQLLQVLTTQQNLTDSQAQCAIDELENTVTDQELQQAITEAAQSGQPPQDLIDSAFQAGANCAGQ